MQSKDLLDLCRQHGIDLKNQLSSIEPDVRDAVEQLVRKGSGGGVAVAAPPRPSETQLARQTGRVQTLPPSRVQALPSRTPPRREAEPPQPAPPPAAPPPPPAPAAQQAPPAPPPPAAP